MVFRGNKPKKKKKGKNLYYPYTDEDMKRVGWCIKHGIEISVSPDRESNGTDKWMVAIRLNRGKYKRDPKSYEHEEAMKKLYEYYKYYYDKNKR